MAGNACFLLDKRHVLRVDRLIVAQKPMNIGLAAANHPSERGLRTRQTDGFGKRRFKGGLDSHAT